MHDPPPPPTLATEKESPGRPWYRLAFFGLLGGSTSLIPLPFVDDWTLDWIRRRMILELTQPQLSLPEPAVRVLLKRGKEPLSGCLNLAIRTPVGIVLYLLKRIFRKIFFFLAVKESTDRAALVFHEGYLLAVAAMRPELHPQIVQGRPEAVRQLAKAVLETLQQTDTSPIRLLVARTLRGSRWLLFAAARQLRRLLPKTTRLEVEPPDWKSKEESVLGELSRSLANVLEGERQYFEQLEKTFASFAARRRVYLDANDPSSDSTQPGQTPLAIE